jgi:hypothetical protein
MDAGIGAEIEMQPARKREGISSVRALEAEAVGSRLRHARPGRGRNGRCRRVGRLRLCVHLVL